MRRDGERDEAHAGGEHAVLRVNAMGGNGRVSGKAAGVGVLPVDVGGAGDVEGLDVEEREGLRSVCYSQSSRRARLILPS